MVASSGGIKSYKGVVLVVEDEAATRDLVTSVAEEAGFLAVAAADSDEAIEMTRSIRVDVLIAQLRAKGQIDGVELAQFLRLANAALRVVFITRFPQAQELGQALGASVIHKSALRTALAEELSGSACR